MEYQTHAISSVAMPPKRGRRQASTEEPQGKRARGKAAPRKKGAYSMPPPLPAGEILTDVERRQWVLGSSIGKGGFGEIYLATRVGSSASAAADHVIKIVRKKLRYAFRGSSFVLPVF